MDKIEKIRLAQSIGELTKIYENWLGENLPTMARDELPSNGKLCAVELWHELQFLVCDKNRAEIEPLCDWLMEFINKWDAILEMDKFHPEFGDFPWSDMPLPIPTDFYDSSWHNDVCPSYYHESQQIRIWINYVDETLREWPLTEMEQRFYAIQENEFGDETEIAASDDWQVILDAIAEYMKNPPLVGLCRNGRPWSECNCC